MIEIKLPLENRDVLYSLKAGDRVLLSGVLYTGRDAAHKKLVALIENGEELPIDLENLVIYYTGPCPAPIGRPIGSCGPTTSGRMDAYAPLLIEKGQAIMIGKGERDSSVVDACKKHKSVYLAAAGGAGALLASCVKECAVVAFPELLSEAIHRLVIEKMPLIVAVDAEGNDIYKIGREKI